MIHYTSVSGWDFRLVSSSNLTDFLTEESQAKMKMIIEKFK
jgi:hypothetical protein